MTTGDCGRHPLGRDVFPPCWNPMWAQRFPLAHPFSPHMPGCPLSARQALLRMLHSPQTAKRRLYSLIMEYDCLAQCRDSVSANHSVLYEHFDPIVDDAHFESGNGLCCRQVHGFAGSQFKTCTMYRASNPALEQAPSFEFFLCMRTDIRNRVEAVVRVTNQDRFVADFNCFLCSRWDVRCFQYARE